MIVCREALDQLSPTCSTVQESKKHKNYKESIQETQSQIPCSQNLEGQQVDIVQIWSKIRRPGSACTVFFFLCRIQNLSQNPKSKIPKLQNPKSKIPKIQNPKSKIPKIQNPKSPKSKIQNPPNLGRWGHHRKICYITVQNPKSRIPKIQNPQNPKSKIPKIQNPKSPRSKIQNPKSPNPKSPKSKIQNPKSPKFGAT